jgi:hypothetical protein
MDNLKEAGQRIRATQSFMRSQGMTEGEGIITFVDGVLAKRWRAPTVTWIMRRAMTDQLQNAQIVPVVLPKGKTA